MTKCTHCGRPLGLNETAWASSLGMFCSKECGIEHAMSTYTDPKDPTGDELRVAAEAYFNDIAEEISREDFGVQVLRTQDYAENLDITLISEDIWEEDTIISTELIGWYYGKPVDITKIDISLKAVFA